MRMKKWRLYVFSYMESESLTGELYQLGKYFSISDFKGAIFFLIKDF